MLSLKELALKIGAEYRGSDLPVPAFSIDSRNLQKGEVFVAIRAERDGHTFIDNAIQNGAAALLLDHAVDAPIPQIIVKDTLKAFGQMAHVWRKQFKIPVIGLTGTCGKTTTKEMIATILRGVGSTLASAGTFNNAYGVPLTLLQLRPEHQFAVIEMGTNSPGEIAYIAEIAEPTVALITNIGASHLEKLGSFEGVSKEKSEIFTFLSEQGIAVLNQDEPFMPSWFAKIGPRHRLTYSIKEPADVFATDIHHGNDGVEFTLHTPIGIQSMKILLPGNHMAANAVAATSVCLAIGVSLDAIGKGLAHVQSVAGRFKQHNLKHGANLIDDSYNSSINSIQNAIETLKGIHGRRVLVVTNLGELGDHTDFYHTELGKWLNEAKLDSVYLYGKKALLNGTLQEYPQAQYFEDKSLLTEAIRQEIQPGTTILIKGINSLKMHTIVDELLQEYHA